MKNMKKLVVVMSDIERKNATLIQRTWRETHQKEGAEGQAASVVQARVRGGQTRKALDQKAKVQSFTEKHAAKVIQRHTIANLDRTRMLKECEAIMEKQGRKLTLLRWEMVVWQERKVWASDSGLVYQHLDSKGVPKGKEKLISFSSMEMIKALLGDVLYVKTTQRDFCFQCSSAVDCEKWATNLVLLAQYAGYTVPGFVVLPPDAEEDVEGDKGTDVASADDEPVETGS